VRKASPAPAPEQGPAEKSADQSNRKQKSQATAFPIGTPPGGSVSSPAVPAIDRVR
jgi:hypothetical protein